MGTDAYYFYISRDKVQKLEQAPLQRKRNIERTVADALSTVTASYGRTTEYRDWSRRLLMVLEALGQSEDVANLSNAQFDIIPQSGWGYAELDLKIADRVGQLMTLTGKLGEAEIAMSCSPVGFLDYDPSKNEIVVTSTNHWFFDGSQSYRFRTHFLILSVDAKKKLVHASPLYLALPLGLLEP